MKSLKAKMLKRLGEHAEGVLEIGGLSVSELDERFGTPIYIFDARILRENFLKLRKALGERVEVLYALKSNPNSAIAQVLRLEGAGAEVASAGEILVAEKAGFSGSQMQFAGPGKSVRDLELAIKTGVSSINIESESEYELICELAQTHEARPGIAVRVNPLDAPGGARMHMGGGSKKFGVDRELVPHLARRIYQDSICEFRGLHVYAGTQSFDAGAWLQNARALLTLANELEEFAPVSTLNFGGGFGVALFEGDLEFDLEAVGVGLHELIKKDDRPERRYFVEPGRFLTASSGVYLSRVLHRKQSAGQEHLILDGGMHHNAAATGLGSIIRRPFPIVLGRAVWDEGEREFTIGGPLCTPADEFAAQLKFPEAIQGDLVAILGTGAYGLTFSNTMFLSHPTPGEVLVDAGEAFLIRESGRNEDALRGQILPFLKEVSR